MTPVSVTFIFVGGWATREFLLHALPRTGEYLILPGLGEMGARIFSVIHAEDRVTLQIRQLDGPEFEQSTLEAMRANGWKIQL